MVNDPDPNAFIVEDSKLLLLQSGSGWDKNWFALKRPIPDGDWDAVVRFNGEFKTVFNYVLLTLRTDKENYLTGQIIFNQQGGHWSRGSLWLTNVMSSNGEETNFDTTIFDDDEKLKDEWLNSFAKSKKPHELGLHKRGREYHFSFLGWDGEGKKHQYETKTLKSLRLPGKELAIVAGTSESAKGQMQVTIDSFEITRVSE